MLRLQGIVFSLGGAPVLDGAELAVAAGDRICLVGRNGSGKSTLLRIAAGLLEAQAGTRFVQPGTTIRVLAQEPDLAGYETVRDYVLAGLGPADDAHRVRRLLDRLGLSGDAAPSVLSGGEARRAALARVLAPSPDLLLLDEPTNHLDLPAIEWLEGELAATGAGLVLVSHDRRLLERVSRRVVWLDRGRTRVLDRGFAHFEAWRDQVLEEESSVQHKLGRQIAREEDWLRYGVTARRKRNVRRVAELASLRRARREWRAAQGQAKLAGRAAPEGGSLVLAADGVGKGFGGRVVVRGLELMVRRGDRLGIVGPNGAGKTTLLRLLTGELAPDRGEVRRGTELRMATLDQARAGLDPARTLAETLVGGEGDQVEVAGQRRHVIGYMKDFLFRPEQARTPVAVLSGGERARLLLAVALARPSNLMVLDEPTNDLDLETLDLMQEMLGGYGGTVLLVSHDRDFLDRVVTSTLAFEGEGSWVEYAGGYSDMVRQRGPVMPESPPAARKLPRAGVPRPARAAAERFSYRDRHALERLPAEIETLAAEVARARDILSDPGLYGRDPTAFAAAGSRLAAAAAALEGAEAKWLELELRRETLEGGA